MCFYCQPLTEASHTDSVLSSQKSPSCKYSPKVSSSTDNWFRMSLNPHLWPVHAMLCTSKEKNADVVRGSDDLWNLKSHFCFSTSGTKQWAVIALYLCDYLCSNRCHSKSLVWSAVIVEFPAHLMMFNITFLSAFNLTYAPAVFSKKQKCVHKPAGSAASLHLARW